LQEPPAIVREESKQNKIVFKNRVLISPTELPMARPSLFPSNQRLSDKLLKNEEVKQLSETYKLSRREIFELRSLFLSMCLASEEAQST